MKALDRLLAKVDPLFAVPAFDETALPAGFPLHATHRALLKRRNGGYFWGGALHVFGACAEPEYHSLNRWNSDDLWRKQYGSAADGLFFFAEDSFGDQFALDANGKVFAFRAERGLVEELADDFEQWLLIATEAPDELLGRQVFSRWATANGRLPYGHQLQAYPPFLFAESDDEVELDAVEAVENMHFHAAIAQQLASIPEGARARIEFTDEGMRITTEEGGAEESGTEGGQPAE